MQKNQILSKISELGMKNFSVSIVFVTSLEPEQDLQVFTILSSAKFVKFLF